MDRVKEHHIDYKKAGYDLNAEAFISILLEEDEIDQSVFLMPNGGFKRNYSKDIEKIIGPFEDSRQLPFGVIEINRKGIYDSLPEGLFHQQQNKKTFKSIDEIKETFARNNQIEADSRKFFWPFDHEILSTRSSIFSSEESQIVHILSPSQKKGLKKFWGLPSFLSAKTQGELFLLLPLSYKISTQPKLTCQVFELILGTSVKLEKACVIHQTHLTHPLRLDELSLGINSTLGRTIKTVEQSFKFTIGPLSKAEAVRYAPGEYKDKVIKCLIDYFIPCDINSSFEIQILEEDKESYLDSSNTRLGVTSFIN